MLYACNCCINMLFCRRPHCRCCVESDQLSRTQLDCHTSAHPERRVAVWVHLRVRDDLLQLTSCVITDKTSKAYINPYSLTWITLYLPTLKPTHHLNHRRKYVQLKEKREFLSASKGSEISVHHSEKCELFVLVNKIKEVSLPLAGCWNWRTSLQTFNTTAHKLTGYSPSKAWAKKILASKFFQFTSL